MKIVKWNVEMPPTRSKSLKKAEIRQLGGIPTLYVDGVPKAPMTFQFHSTNKILPPMPPITPKGKEPLTEDSWIMGTATPTKEDLERKRKQLKALAEAGIEIYLPRIEFADPAHVDWGLSELDREVALLQQAFPEAYIIPWITIFPYAEFGKKYPNEVQTFNDGSTGPYTRPKSFGLEGPNAPRYTWASEVWKEEVNDIIVKMVRHVNNVSYKDRVIGYFFFPHCYETSYFWDWEDGNRSIDYSPAMLERFRKWLRKEYKGDVNALKGVWKKGEVDFESAQLPSKDAKKKTDFGGFWDPDRSKPVIDYWKCHSEAIAEKIVHFAKVVKKESINKVVVGFFYGYLQNQEYLYGGQSVFKGVLNDDAVDFWAAPLTYENRGPGDHASIRFLSKTIKDHGRLWFTECDVLTYDLLKTDPVLTPEQTVEILKRDFAYVLCESVTGWWIDWSSGPSFYKEPIISLLKRQQQIGRASLDYPRGSTTEIAAVVDQESILVTQDFGYRPQLKERERVDPYRDFPAYTYMTLDRLKIHELPRIGSPCDFYEMDDILREEAQRYRMYIFLNPYSIDNNERKLILNRLKRQGSTLVWIYAPGLINPDASPTLSLKHMEDLTGMKFNCIQEKQRSRIRIENYDDPITSGLPKGTEFGDFVRPLTWGISTGTREKRQIIKLPPVMVDPLFYVDDPEAVVLGRYMESGKPGFALKRFKDWTSVYVGSVAISSSILRTIAKAAGSHLYSEMDDIIYANQSFLAIHTSKPGERLLKLQRKADAYEVFDDKVLGRNVSSLKMDLPAYATKLIFLGNVDEFRRKLENAK